MCILYVMIEDQPRAGGFKLVLCSIRDEFFQRPTKLAHKWTSENGESKLLGGRVLFFLKLNFFCDFFYYSTRVGLSYF